MLDLTEETEIIELIEELKTKQVKYPRKGKGVRRKRSNTSKLVSQTILCAGDSQEAGLRRTV